MSKVENGQTVSVHYVGTLDDGTEFDNSRSRGTPLSFQVGTGQMISGFDSALPGMEVGDTKSVKVPAKDAYGDINPEAFQTAPRGSFPPDFEFEVGKTVIGQGPGGQQFSAKIYELVDEGVKLDFNHPLAGKNLNFEIELVDVG